MKVFIFASVCLILCFAFTLFGTVYTTSTIEKLGNAADDLPAFLPQGENSPEDVLEGVRNALNIWQGASKMTLLGMSHSDYDEVEGFLKGMETAVLCGEGGAFANFATSLREKLKKLAVSEGFSFDGVF